MTNSEVGIPAEIVDDLVGELEARLSLPEQGEDG